MPANKLFLMAGGGTGGHVIPALAVARELRNRGHDAFFVGTERGVEARIVPPAELQAYSFINIGGLKNLGVLRKVTSLLQLVARLSHLSSSLRVPRLCSAWAVTWPVYPYSPQSSGEFPWSSWSRMLCPELPIDGSPASSIMLCSPSRRPRVSSLKGRTEIRGTRRVREDFFRIKPKASAVKSSRS